MAMGLIYQKTKNQAILNQFIEAIKNPGHNSNEVLIHGCCLGLGLVGMASEDMIIYEELKSVLFCN